MVSAPHAPAEGADPVPLTPFVTGPLLPTPPFSWRQTKLALLAAPHVPGAGRRAASGGWEFPFALSSSGRVVRVVVLPLRAPGRGGSRALLPHAPASQALNEGEEREVREQLKQFLSLPLDLTPLTEEARHDPAFSVVERALHGLHPPLFRSAFEAACYAVVRQRTPVGFANATMERIAKLLGRAAPAPPGSPLTLFPEPGIVARGARRELLAATNNVRKVERLEGLAREFVSVSSAELRAAPYSEAFGWLRGLPGIGPWSAEQVLWRGLGRFERVPWRDTRALADVSAAYAPGFTLEAGAARRLARPYGDLKGLWLWYLKAHRRAHSRAAPPPNRAERPESP